MTNTARNTGPWLFGGETPQKPRLTARRDATVSTTNNKRLTKFEEIKARYPLQRSVEKVYPFDDYLSSRERERKREINISKSGYTLYSYWFYSLGYKHVSSYKHDLLSHVTLYNNRSYHGSLLTRLKHQSLKSIPIFSMQSCASEVWRVNVTMLEIPSRNSIDSNGGRKEGETHGFETHDSLAEDRGGRG